MRQVGRGRIRLGTAGTLLALAAVVLAGCGGGASTARGSGANSATRHGSVSKSASTSASAAPAGTILGTSMVGTYPPSDAEPGGLAADSHGVYEALGDGGLVAMSPTLDHTRWTYAVNSNKRIDQVFSEPYGLVVAGDEKPSSSGLNANPGGLLIAVLDPATGKERWSHVRPSAHCGDGGCVVADAAGIVAYSGSNPSNFYLFSAAGTMRTTPASPPNLSNAISITGNFCVFMLPNGGGLGRFDITTGRVLAPIPVPGLSLAGVNPGSPQFPSIDTTDGIAAVYEPQFTSDHNDIVWSIEFLNVSNGAKVGSPSQMIDQQPMSLVNGVMFEVTYDSSIPGYDGVQAIDTTSGKVMWSHPGADASFLAGDGNIAIFYTSDAQGTQFVGVDSKSGRQLWTGPRTGLGGGRVAAAGGGILAAVVGVNGDANAGTEVISVTDGAK